jgi:hypothetical protein
MGWELAAFDGNRYPAGNIGLQQELAVRRQARAIARARGGFATGGSATGPAASRRRGPGPPPVLRQNPRSRPRIPPVPEVTAPPPGDLALTPDGQPPQPPPRLDGLDAFSWSDFGYGTGVNPVPAELARRADARADRDWGERLLELWHTVMPDGTCRPDTGTAVTIVARLLLGDMLTAARRAGVYSMLIEAASRYASDVITGADIVAATGTLAAVFRSHGQVLAGRVAVLAAGQRGSRVGSCARIAGQLIAGEIQDAVQTAAVMSRRDGTRTEYDTGSELLDQAVLAQAIRCDEVAKLLA